MKRIIQILILFGLVGVANAGNFPPTAPQIPYNPGAVIITGGTIDGVTIGGVTPGDGTFLNLTSTSSFTSPGIDDNANAIEITIDSSENTGHGIPVPEYPFHLFRDTAGGGSAGTGIMTIEGRHNTIHRPYLYLRNAIAGTTFTGGVRWLDGNGNIGWATEVNNIRGNNIFEFNLAGVNQARFEANGDFVLAAGNSLGGGVAPIYALDIDGAINSRVYSWADEYDYEVAGVQFESGLTADGYVTAGTNYAAANVTFLGLEGGTIKALNAAADDDSVTIIGINNFNTDNNPIYEASIKLDVKETAAFCAGFANAAMVDINTFDQQAILVCVNSDDPGGDGATAIIIASKDAGAGVIYDDTGLTYTSNTWTKIKIELSDLEQPRVWIDDVEIASGSISGTVQAATTMAPYVMVQNLAGGAIQRFITVANQKGWMDQPS